MRRRHVPRVHKAVAQARARREAEAAAREAWALEQERRESSEEGRDAAAHRQRVRAALPKYEALLGRGSELALMAAEYEADGGLSIVPIEQREPPGREIASALATALEKSMPDGTQISSDAGQWPPGFSLVFSAPPAVVPDTGAPSPIGDPQAYMRCSMRSGPEHMERWRGYLSQVGEPARSEIDVALREVDEEMRRAVLGDAGR